MPPQTSMREPVQRLTIAVRAGGAPPRAAGSPGIVKPTQAGVQALAVQVRPCPQVFPHEPQLAASVVTLTHAPPHATSGEVHAAMHLLPEHALFAPQSESVQHS